MAKLSYPAIIERGKGGFGVWFPDLDGCTSAGDSIEHAIANANEALGFASQPLGADQLLDDRNVLRGSGSRDVWYGQ